MAGQRGGGNSNPQAALAMLVAKREKLQEELRMVEKQVYEMETTYLHDSSQCGNVLKGFEGYLSSTKSAGNLKRLRKFQLEDRLFSLSSVTSPAAEEHAAGRDADGKIDGLGQNRGKAGGLISNGPGKQKRGRTAPRDGKRIRKVNEQELDDDDEADFVSQ